MVFGIVAVVRFEGIHISKSREVWTNTKNLCAKRHFFGGACRELATAVKRVYVLFFPGPAPQWRTQRGSVALFPCPNIGAKGPPPPQEFMQIGKRRRDTPPPNHPFLSPFWEYGSISCCNAIVSDRDIGLNPKTYPQKIFSSRKGKESIWIKSSALSSSWVCAQDIFAALLSNLLRKAGSSPPPPVLGFLPLFLLFSASSPSPLYSVVPTKGNDGKRTKFAKPAYFFCWCSFPLTQGDRLP